MKTKIKIPKGWRKLRVGDIRRVADRFGFCRGKWEKCWQIGDKITASDMGCCGPYIRRSKPRSGQS